jgi:orotate phosphoribosyltransferase
MRDLDRDSLLQLFRQSGALLDGHFRLSSGLHSSGYLQCALVLQDPRSGLPSRRRSAS